MSADPFSDDFNESEYYLAMQKLKNSTGTLGRDLKHDDTSCFITDYLEHCSTIQPRLRMSQPSEDTDCLVTPFRTQARLIKQHEDPLNFVVSFGMERHELEELRFAVDKFYRIALHRIKAEPKKGHYYIAFIREYNRYVRVKLNGECYGNASVSAIDYGSRHVLDYADIYQIHCTHTKENYAYHLVVECCLPQEPLLSLLPPLDAFTLEADVDLYILTEVEPCMAVILPVDDMYTLHDEFLYRGLADNEVIATKAALNTVIDDQIAVRPSMVVPSMVPNEWACGEVVCYESVGAVWFRDAPQGVRIARMQESLNVVMMSQDFRDSMALLKSLLQVRRPVIAFDEKTKSYYRAVITAVHGGCTVKCVDFPAKQFKLPDKNNEDEYFSDLYLMPDVLSRVPIQCYRVPAYVFSEHTEKYRHVVEYFCESFFTPGDIVAVREDLLTRNVEIESGLLSRFSGQLEEIFTQIEPKINCFSSYPSAYEESVDGNMTQATESDL